MKRESQNIEWKESWHDDYLRWVCGFANSQGGSVVSVKMMTVPPLVLRTQRNLWKTSLYAGLKPPVIRDDMGGIWIEFTPRMSAETTMSEKMSGKMSEKIIARMGQSPQITAAELAKELEVTSRTIDREIAELKNLGRIRRIGGLKGGHWEVHNNNEREL